MTQWGVVALAVIGAVVALAWSGHKVVHAEQVVSASPDRVWAVLTDAAGYAEWNPIFVSAQGEFRQGGGVVYEMKSPDGAVSRVEPEIRKLEVEREINQYGGLPGILTFDHTWHLEPVAGGTRVTQHEEYRGLYVWFWDPAWVERAYEEAIIALSERVAN